MASQVSGLQLSAMQRLFLQLWPEGHIMQSTERPHPSPMTPQYFPPAGPASVAGTLQVNGLQVGPPTQTFFSQLQSVPSGVQSPHLKMLPQLSPMSPQYRPPVTAQLMRQGLLASRPLPLSSPVPGGSPPDPPEPPVGVMVPPTPDAPPSPPALAPAEPPDPELPPLARTGGASDEQLARMTKTTAHNQAAPRD
jgi:hypothetical protein